MRFVGLLVALLAVGCASGASLTPGADDASSQVIFEQLRSDNEAEARAALAAVEAEPGAYLPSVFGGVARELFEAGRVEEALVWDRFGMLRMMEDIEFAGRISDRANHMAMSLLLSYQTDEGEALAARMQAASLEERRAIADQADAMSARHVRRYAPTWVLHGRAPYEQNFVTSPAAWSQEDLAALADIRSHVSAELREMDEAQAAQR